MATVVVTNGSVNIDGVDLSSDVNRATIEYGAQAQTETAFGDTTEIVKGGLKTWSITVEGHQDMVGATGPNAVLFSNVGSVVALIIKQSTSATAVTNPSYTGNGLLTEYSPQQMVQGELQPFRAVFQNAGNLVEALA